MQIEEDKTNSDPKAAEDKAKKDEEARIKNLLNDGDKIIAAYFRVIKNLGMTKFIGKNPKLLNPWHMKYFVFLNI